MNSEHKSTPLFRFAILAGIVSVLATVIVILYPTLVVLEQIDSSILPIDLYGASAEIGIWITALIVAIVASISAYASFRRCRPEWHGVKKTPFRLLPLTVLFVIGSTLVIVIGLVIIVFLLPKWTPF